MVRDFIKKLEYVPAQIEVRMAQKTSGSIEKGSQSGSTNTTG